MREALGGAREKEELWCRFGGRGVQHPLAGYS